MTRTGISGEEQSGTEDATNFASQDGAVQSAGPGSQSDSEESEQPDSMPQTSPNWSQADNERTKGAVSVIAARNWATGTATQD